MPRRQQPRSSKRSTAEAAQVVGLRIIGGRFRGRRLQYSGDIRTRPMKDRVREATFNRLGKALEGCVAVDLFAGTGACGLEALSRGAVRAIFVEQHRPTAELITASAAQLGAAHEVTVLTADALRDDVLAAVPAERPWGVFVCPPYELLTSEAAAMRELVARIVTRAPHGSLVVFEADIEFDWTTMPAAELWDVRAYPPATIGIAEIDHPGES